ncbi:MAG TPA: hypothetical protein VK797_08910, partial [Tepidisphaeraceae bacterium]|nr:hypothetical protein [Tepidisphaeraceae bacterium]
QTLTIKSLPVGAPGVDTANTTGQVPYDVSGALASTATQQIFVRSLTRPNPPPAAPATSLSPATTATVGDLTVPASPTAPLGISLTSTVPNPATAATPLFTELDTGSSLPPDSTYFVTYTWAGMTGGETAASPESSIVNSTPDPVDFFVAIPPAPPGASNVNVYIGTAPGAERLAGQFAPGTLGFRSLPSSTAPAAPTTSTFDVPPGTYYFEYTWANENPNYETTPSPEQTFVVTAPNHFISVTFPALPSDVSSGLPRVYLGTASGQELFVGTFTLSTLAISALPTIDAKPAPTQASPDARFFTPAHAFQLTSNAIEQTGSAFNLGENIAGFLTSFDFQLTGDLNSQGFGFVLQDQAQNALPTGNFSASIGPSVGIFFNPNVATTGGNSTGLSIDGAAPTWIDMTRMNGVPTGIVLSSASALDQRAGDIYNVTLTYDNNTHLFTETVRDLTMNARGFNTLFTSTWSIDIVATLGMPAAYAGFVGASGNPGAGEQDILNWSFLSGSFGDNINGTGGIDQITLRQDPDHQQIDWTLNGGPTYVLPINDPNGLSINANGGNDTITLDYSNGNPVPATVHLNGTFVLNGLQGTNPLAGTTLDINRSTLFISYTSSDPIAAIQSYLRNAYNNGAWNGTPTATAGVITSLAAQSNPGHNTAIGYADFADGQGIDPVPNTVELTCTLYGDANLDHQVNSADLQILLFGLNRPGAWDQGDFNYDGQVNSADLQAILFTLNTSLGNQATPLAVAASAMPLATAASASPTARAATTPTSSSDPPPGLMPVVHPTGSTAPAHHPLLPSKPPARKRKD